MLDKRDQAILLDIARAARAVVEFSEGMDMAGFLADRKTASAVQHQLMVIGEAVKRLSKECYDTLSGIPWAPIARIEPFLPKRDSSA